MPIASRIGSMMRTPQRGELRGVVEGSCPSSPIIMQIGWRYSTATPRMALMESRKPVYWMSVNARLSEYERPEAMPMHSSSLQTRMSLNAESREMGRSRPPLVTISGTERMNSTPLALIAAMMDEPLSSIVSSPAVSKSASMRDLQRRCGETSAPVPKRKSQIPATGLPSVASTAACGRAATPASWLRMSTPWSRLAAALVFAVAGSTVGPASAADWPTRPLRIIAPSTPGGAADMFGRLVCDHFSEAFHERCFVENRAGADGLIGMAAAAQAAPDGYTLATSSIAYNVIAPAVSPNPGFDPLKEFTHIAYIGGPPNVFVVNPALNVRSIAELVTLGRRGPAIDYVSPGVGTLGHLTAEVFAQKAGIKLQQIMTKGGSQAMMDLISGNVNVGTMTWTSALAQIRAGKVIPIAITASARLPEFPDLPTFKDLGYDVLTAVTWFALSGPAGLPNDVTQRLNAAIAKMLELPDVRKRLDRDAVETRVMTSDEFTAFVASEIDRWTPVARRVMPGK